MHPSGAVSRRSLLVTTVVVLVIAMMTVVPARGRPEPAANDVQPATAPTTLPPGLPTQAEVAAAARTTCADLPLPRVAASEVEACERWFAAAATEAIRVGVESGARSQTELAVAMCDGPDCSAFVAAPELAGLSKYEWPRVRLVASLSVTAALAYVTVQLT